MRWVVVKLGLYHPPANHPHAGFVVRIEVVHLGLRQAPFHQVPPTHGAVVLQPVNIQQRAKSAVLPVQSHLPHLRSVEPKPVNQPPGPVLSEHRADSRLIKTLQPNKAVQVVPRKGHVLDEKPRLRVSGVGRRVAPERINPLPV